LYGDEPSLEKTKTELQQCITNEKELTDKERVVTRVRIWMGDKQPEYFFRRTLCISKSSSDTHPEEHERTWRASYLEGRNWRSYSGLDWRNMTQFKNLVSNILPEGIRSFFFFDGERLDDFFRKGMEHEVKKAMIKVCQIELLDRCIDHLTDRSTELRRGIKGASSEVKSINDEIEALTRSDNELRKDIEELNKKISEASNNKEDIEEKLRKCAVSDAQEFQRERDRLEIEIKELDKKIENEEKEIKRHFASGIIFIFGFDALEKTYEMIDRRIKGVDQPPIPPDIKDKFLKDLLSRYRCICGTDLPEGSPQRESIEKLLNSVEFSSKISDDATEGYYRIANILEKCKEFKSERNKLEREYQELREGREERDQRLKEISERLKGMPIDEIQNLEKLRDSFEDEIRKCIGERSQKELQLQTMEDKIKIGNMALKKEIEKDKKQEKLRLKLELCDKSIEALNGIKEKVVGEIREKVEQKTKEYFLSLIWKREAFKDIKINEDYEISVINNFGFECLGTLSAGERQVLALSFMAALSSVSGFEAPVIIDTPLGRISGEPKEKIAKSLPKYLKNSQLTLLITDQEFTSSVRNNMKERIGKEFELKYYEEEMNTEIVETGGGT
jgi:DNA sulfur modification protein DndD